VKYLLHLCLERHDVVVPMAGDEWTLMLPRGG
jgi:hypothetical protein